MSDRTEPRISRSLAAPDLLRAPSRKPRRHDPCTEDATIPMLHSPFRVSYARSEPPPRKRGLACFLRELASDTRADLMHIAELARGLPARVQRSLGHRATVGVVAASLGLCTGLLVMQEPAPPVSALAPLPAAIAASEDVMCNAPMVSPVETAPAAAPRPRAVERVPPVKRVVTRGSDVRAKPIKTARPKPAKLAKAAPAGSAARQRILAEEAVRAEKAEFASAGLVRRRPAR